MRLRLFLPILLLLPLAGCYSDQAEQLATCQADAVRAFPKPLPGQRLKSTQSCMDQAGYRFIGWNDGVVCDMAAVVQGKMSPTGSGAECFEPKGWLALKIYRVEVPSRGSRAAS